MLYNILYAETSNTSGFNYKKICQTSDSGFGTVLTREGVI